jgi:hypothetical protein
MDTLYLPYLRERDTLDAAIEAMIQTDSRAAVVEDKRNECRLYLNDEFWEALDRNKIYCSELPAPAGKNVVPLAGSLKMPTPWMAEVHLNELLEARLAEAQAAYGMLYPPQRHRRSAVVLIVTRHEGDTEAILGRKKTCKCTWDPTHMDTDPPARHGARCHDCGKGTYRCA